MNILFILKFILQIFSFGVSIVIRATRSGGECKTGRMPTTHISACFFFFSFFLQQQQANDARYRVYNSLHAVVGYVMLIDLICIQKTVSDRLQLNLVTNESHQCPSFRRILCRRASHYRFVRCALINAESGISFTALLQECYARGRRWTHLTVSPSKSVRGFI